MCSSHIGVSTLGKKEFLWGIIFQMMYNATNKQGLKFWSTETLDLEFVLNKQTKNGVAQKYVIFSLHTVTMT